MRVLRVLLTVGLVCVSSVSGIVRAMAGDLEVENAWSRATVAAGSTGVVYMTIRNTGAMSDRLIAVASPVAATAQVHETRSDEDGTMSMAPVAAVAIPAHGEAMFLPGGLHIMLVGLRTPLTYRDHFVVDLTFEHAGHIRAMVKVEKAGARRLDTMDGMKM